MINSLDPRGKEDELKSISSQSLSSVSAILSDSYEIRSELSLVNQKKINDVRHKILELNKIL